MLPRGCTWGNPGPLQDARQPCCAANVQPALQWQRPFLELHVANKTLPYLSAALLAYLVGLLAFAVQRAPTAERIDADNPALVELGKTVYANHCAACHGANLQGQAGWQRPGPDGRLPAPPHDESGHTWHHSDAYLIHVVQQGLVAGLDRPPDYQGNMPAFGQQLSREQIVAAMSFIKSRWSFDYRAWQERANQPEAPSTRHAQP